MIEVVIAAFILGVTLSLMVGPVFLLLLETALTKGIKKALIFDLGVILADIIFIIAVVLGSSMLGEIANIQWIYSFGGVLLISYGIYNLRNAAKKKIQLASLDKLPTVKPASSAVYLMKGFLLNFLNIGVLAYWLATVLVMRTSVENDPKKMAVYFVVTLIAYFLVDLLKIFSARKLRPYLNDKIFVRVERVLGIVLIGFGVVMIARSFVDARHVDMSSRFLM